MRVIITDCDHKDISVERELFGRAGLDFKLLQCRTEDDLINQCAGAEIFLNQYAPITDRVMAGLPDLKLVVRYGVGVDNVDVASASKRGVQVCNVPDYGVDEVADQAMALMLTLLRKTAAMNAHTKTVAWDYTKAIPIRRLNRLTVGVAGIGRIGRNFARKASAFGCRIIGCDPFYSPRREDGTDFIEAVSFEELLIEADVISVHCPLDTSRNLFGAAAFGKMKKSALLINTARGGIVNERDLDLALEKGEIAGAALDCMENEPVNPGNPLFRHENFIATPHMSWYSEESCIELKRKAAEEAVRFAAGEAVKYPVN